VVTFGLVHGAWHGAWCWEKFVPELRARGHQAVAMDLPIDDPTATVSTYADVVIDALGDADDVVLVGHSLGGLTIPVVAARRPVSAMVFLCPVVPSFNGSPWADAPPMEVPGLFDELVSDDSGGVRWPNVAAAQRAFYHDCTRGDAAWAFTRLRTQNSRSLFASPYPLTEWPPGKRIGVIGVDDRAVTPEHARFTIRERLGVTPIELPGAHSPFLARPAELADCVVAAVAD
jgi:pimeloyl-ACP methyl ester carboxylesterase